MSGKIVKNSSSYQSLPDLSSSLENQTTTRSSSKPPLTRAKSAILDQILQTTVNDTIELPEQAKPIVAELTKKFKKLLSAFKCVSADKGEL